MELKLRIAVEPSNLSGKPEMVIIVGGKKRIPYDGQMTLDSFFCECQGCEIEGDPLTMAVRAAHEMNEIKRDHLRSLGDIHKRDTVKCVKVNPREGGIPLVLGQEYSVLAKEGGMFVLFGDEGRVYAQPDEIEFVKSNPPVTHLKREMEETKICETCGEVYVGECECQKVKA